METGSKEGSFFTFVWTRKTNNQSRACEREWIREKRKNQKKKERKIYSFKTRKKEKKGRDIWSTFASTTSQLIVFRRKSSPLDGCLLFNFIDPWPMNVISLSWKPERGLHRNRSHSHWTTRELLYKTCPIRNPLATRILPCLTRSTLTSSLSYQFSYGTVDLFILPHVQKKRMIYKSERFRFEK